MTLRSRREILCATAAATVGASALAAVGAAALNELPYKEQTPAHLRGAAPLPYTEVISLDLVTSEKNHRNALHAAHRAVAAIDEGKTASWLALGESAFAHGVDMPRHLKRMPSFAGDVLDPTRSHGDLLIQVTGASAQTVRETAEQMLHTLKQWRVRWRLTGQRPENRAEDGRGLSRNPFHFTEGYGNPATATETIERATVRAHQGEPPWAVGGSYQVVRIIQLATDFWDRDTLHEQERIIGRRRDGRWLDGTPRSERPAFTTDPQGKITPLDAHVRRAAPDRRNPPPLVRRGYNYHRSAEDQGLIFSCFQSDLAKGFEAVQKRLQGEAMAKYILTTGGGYFFVPPPGEQWIDAALSEVAT